MGRREWGTAFCFQKRIVPDSSKRKGSFEGKLHNKAKEKKKKSNRKRMAALRSNKNFICQYIVAANRMDLNIKKI